MAHFALTQVPVVVSINNDNTLHKSVFKSYNVSFREKPWASRLSVDFNGTPSWATSQPVICMSVQQASCKAEVAVSPLSLEEAKEPPLHLYKNKEPYTGTIVSVERLVGPKAPRRDVPHRD